MTVYNRRIIEIFSELPYPILTVENVTKNNDKDIVVTCRNKDTGSNIPYFRKDILLDNELPFIELHNEFHTIRNIYTTALLVEIKEILRTFLTDERSKLNISEIIEEYFGEIGKYETPKDYPANYILKRFCLRNNESFYAEGDDIDNPDGEWTFYEKDFTVSELEDILDGLRVIRCYMKRGFLRIDDEGNVKIARYRHVGYYNDTEDLAYFTGKDAEEIVSSMEKNEGHFYMTSDDGEELTANKLECDFNDGKHRAANGGQTYSFIRNGKYLVVNEILSIKDPAAAFKEIDPDSGTFIDIYVRVDD